MKSITTIILLILISCTTAKVPDSNLKIYNDPNNGVQIGYSDTLMWATYSMVGDALIDSCYQAEWEWSSDDGWVHAPQEPNPKLDSYNIIYFQHGRYPIYVPNDTIRCIMLVCDTAINYATMENNSVALIEADSLGRFRSMHYRTDTISKFKVVAAKWQYGYKTNVHHSSNSKFTVGANGAVIFENNKEIYLNEDKKPLSKSIVVWQSIEIKK